MSKLGKKSREGSFLVESMIGLTLVTVGLLGLITLITRSLILNENIRNRFIAAALAAEGIEVVKNIIDTAIARGSGWEEMKSSGGVYGQNCNIQTPCFADYDDESLSDVAPTGDCGEFLCFDSATGLYSYESGSRTIYKRSIIIDESGDRISVKSGVRWIARDQNHSINIEDYFYNWRQYVTNYGY